MSSITFPDPMFRHDAMIPITVRFCLVSRGIYECTSARFMADFPDMYALCIGGFLSYISEQANTSQNDELTNAKMKRPQAHPAAHNGHTPSDEYGIRLKIVSAQDITHSINKVENTDRPISGNQHEHLKMHRHIDEFGTLPLSVYSHAFCRDGPLQR